MNPTHIIGLFFIILVPFTAFAYFFSRHRSVWTVVGRPVIIAVAVVGTLFLVDTHFKSSEGPKPLKHREAQSAAADRSERP